MLRRKEEEPAIKSRMMDKLQRDEQQKCMSKQNKISNTAEKIALRGCLQSKSLRKL
jgi:hypothetical protein